MDHAPRLGRKSMPQSPQISISPVDEDADRSGLIGSRVLDTVVEVKGVGVAVSHPIIELSNNGNKRSGKGKCQNWFHEKLKESVWNHDKLLPVDQFDFMTQNWFIIF